jgi:hypothetical protein
MKTYVTVAAIAVTLVAATPAFAGRDGVQQLQHERAIAAAKKERLAQNQGVAGPAGSAQAAREGAPGAPSQPIKRVHPKTGL